MTYIINTYPHRDDETSAAEQFEDFCDDLEKALKQGHQIQHLQVTSLTSGFLCAVAVVNPD